MTEYSSHKQQLERASPSPVRAKELELAFTQAFKEHVYLKEVGVVRFSDLNVTELAHALHSYPILVKHITACVNVAQRAIKRDLKIDIDTYGDSLALGKAHALAGYLMPLLPKEMEIPALVELDRYFWVDKEMRAQKGSWEKRVEIALSSKSKRVFRKIKFDYEDEEFEIDAAYLENSVLLAGFDAKRIESPRDIHKRSDEIMNKAVKVKSKYPESKFYAIVYYPFPEQHINVMSRLKSDFINGIFFASETDSSIEQAAEMALSRLGWLLEHE